MRTTVIWPSADYARDVTRSGDRDRTDLGEPWAESVPPALRRACRDEVARADGRGKIARCTLLRTRRDSHVVCRAQRAIHPRVHQPVLYARGQSARDHVTAQRGEDQRQSLYAREDKVSRADDRSDEVLDESRCVVRRPVLDPSGISDRVEVRAATGRLAAFGRDAAGVRFAAVTGFLRDTGRATVRRGFAIFFFGSFIVSSIFTSCFVSSRQTPGVSFGSEIGPMATRRSFETG